MEQILSLKSLISEGKESLIEKEETVKASKKIKNIPHIEIALENDSDFVLRRTTATTSKMLVCILSQGLIYLKDEKVDKIEHITYIKTFENFLSGTDYGTIKFTKLKYKVTKTGYGTPHISDFMSYAIKNKETIKELVNKKIFIDNPASYDNQIWMKSVSEHKDGYNLLDLSFECAKLVFGNDNITYHSISESEAARSLYYIFSELYDLGITRDKIKYNIQFFENCANWCEYNLCHHNKRKGEISSLTKCVQLGNLELNRFFNYISYLINQEGLNRNSGSGYYYSGFTLDNYYDYLNMQSNMYGKVREKYPLNWLTEERKLITTYNNWQKLHKEEVMLNMSKKIEYLKYSNKKYCIVIPTTSNDVVDEGARLGHCVGSYVDRIIAGETSIVFMRDVKTPEESLVTVEVKNNQVYQYKGRADRDCTKEELEFLLEWGIKNKLDVTYLERDLGRGE